MQSRSNLQALYTKLFKMIDELNGAHINKRFFELGEERFEKILEESRDLGMGWELEDLQDKLTNAGEKEIVSILRRAAQALQREKRTDRNLKGAEHNESILRERKVEN